MASFGPIYENLRCLKHETSCKTWSFGLWVRQKRIRNPHVFLYTLRFLICFFLPRDQNTRFCEKSKYFGPWVRSGFALQASFCELCPTRRATPDTAGNTPPYALRASGFVRAELCLTRSDGRPVPPLFGLAQKPKYAGQQEVY